MKNSDLREIQGDTAAPNMKTVSALSPSHCGNELLKCSVALAAAVSPPAGVSSMQHGSLQVRHDVLVITPTHLLASEGATTDRASSWTGLQRRKGPWLQRTESGFLWTSEGGQARALLWAEAQTCFPGCTASSCWCGRTSSGHHTTLLTVEPEQARGRGLGSSVLDTGVPWFFTLHRAAKREQTGFPGVEGTWALPGLTEDLTHSSLSGHQPTIQA